MGDLIRLRQPTLHLAAEQSHCCTRPFGARRSDQIHIIALLPFPGISFTLPQRTLNSSSFSFSIIFVPIFTFSFNNCVPSFFNLETILNFLLCFVFCLLLSL